MNNLKIPIKDVSFTGNVHVIMKGDFKGQYYFVPDRSRWRLVKWAIKDFFIGVFKEKFPVCCCYNYALLVMAGLLPNLTMNKVYGEDDPVGYVRCAKCRKVNFDDDFFIS